jgi:hypothetical protein
MVVDADNIACKELCAPVLMGVVPNEETIAELDAEEQEDEDHIKDEDADFEMEQGNTDGSSVMKTCLKAAQARLRKEMSDPTMNSEEKWLLEELLEDDEWWIESKRTWKVCRKMGLQFAGKACCHNVRVWFPELQHGQECMPSCVSCGSICKVGLHGCSKKRPACCRVVALTMNCFMMSPQCASHVCSKKKRTENPSSWRSL